MHGGPVARWYMSSFHFPEAREERVDALRRRLSNVASTDVPARTVPGVLPN